MIKRLLLAGALLGASAGAAAVEIAATTSSMGALARAVGGDAVSVTVMAPPDRDVHHLEARPSMMRDLRRADLVVAVGAELEEGWLPAALRGARNPAVQVGSRGYFEAAAQVDRLDAGGVADRARGDVHPTGNPHVNLDPVRMQTIATALAERLGRLDEANRDRYRENAAAFHAAVEERLDDWREQLADAPGVVLYHKDADYLMRRFDVPIHGYVEPLPGIPPSARHLRDLIADLRGIERAVVLHTEYQSARGPRRVAEELGWPRHALPLDPPVEATTADYLAHIQQWVDAVAGH